MVGEKEYMKSINRFIAALLTASLLSAGLLNAEAAEKGTLKPAGTSSFVNGSSIEAGPLTGETSKAESGKKAANSNSAEKEKDNSEKKSGQDADTKADLKAAGQKSIKDTADKSAVQAAEKKTTQTTKKANTNPADKKTTRTTEKKTTQTTKKPSTNSADKKTTRTTEKKTTQTTKKPNTNAADKKTTQTTTKKPNTNTADKKTTQTTEKKTTQTTEKKVEVKENIPAAIEKAKNTALDALSARLSRTRECVYVYKDYSLTHNHFTQRSKIYGSDDDLVKDMDENYTKKPYSGTSCIRCEQTSRKKDWGGWMFLNGYLKEWDRKPKPNDGNKGGAGLNLTGANALRFYARGKKGGEVVEFFTCGFGYDKTNKKTVANPDSSMRKSTGQVTLTRDWKEYIIPLKGANLNYVVCGFGYEVDGKTNGKKDVVFYLDEIRFTGKIRSAQTAPVLLRSSDEEDIKVKNAAFTEDNALVAMAFLSAGKKNEAKQILDAFVYAVQNDRAYDSSDPKDGPRRARNAYAVGDISAFPGWNSGTRMSGWYDKDSGMWIEDQHEVGSSSGTNSYVALALLQYYTTYGDETYLKTARSLMDWILKKCYDNSLGFTEGFDGWKESDSLGVYPLTKRTTKDNLIAYAAFSRLYDVTADEKYLEASQSAVRFVENMYNEWKGRFVVETLEDGFTPDPTSIVLLDVQSLSGLAMWDSFAPYHKTLSTIEDLKVRKGGYAYNRNNKKGGWWSEGTAFTALMYRVLGKQNKYEEAMNALVKIQAPNGLFPAATIDKYYTGITLYDGSSLRFTKDTHIAPSAWFIMAANGYNPFAPHGTKNLKKAKEAPPVVTPAEELVEETLEDPFEESVDEPVEESDEESDDAWIDDGFTW